MSTTRFLNVIRTQRHDFINHLQVISGYLQLGKKESALEYVEHLSEELRRAGRINRVVPPEVRAVFLFAAQDAADIQVEFNCQVETTLANSAVSAETVAAVLEEVFAAVFDIFKTLNDDYNICFDIKHTDENPGVEVILKELPGEYLVLIKTCLPGGEALEKVKKRLDVAKKKYAGRGVKINTGTADRLELKIALPVK